MIRVALAGMAWISAVAGLAAFTDPRCGGALQRCMDVIGTGSNANGQLRSELSGCIKTPQLAACLGTSHLMNGNIREALADLSFAMAPLAEAVASASDESRPQAMEMATFAAHNLGIAQVASQRFTAAVETFRTALELHGANTTELLMVSDSLQPDSEEPHSKAIRLPAAAMPTVMALAFRGLRPGPARMRLFRLILAHSLQRQDALATDTSGMPTKAWVEERHRECETRFSMAAQAQALGGADAGGAGIGGPAQAAFHSLSRCPCGSAMAVSSPLLPVYGSASEESLGRARLLAAAASLALPGGSLFQLSAACQADLHGSHAADSLASLAGIHTLLGDAAYSSSYFALNDVWLKRTLLSTASRLLHTAASSLRPATPGAVLGWGSASAPASSSSLAAVVAASPFMPAALSRWAASPSVRRTGDRGAWRGRAGLKRRIRVCFVTSFTSRHSVAKMSLPLMLQLPRDLFEVAAVLAAPLGEDEVSQALLAAERDGALVLSRGLPEGTGRIAATLLDVEEARSLRCDAAVFPELGMSARVMGIAASRIAPFQLVTHGHSVTSGLDDAVDAFVSLDAAELNETRLYRDQLASETDEGANGGGGGGGWRRYSEQLIRLQAPHSQFWEVPSLPEETGEEATGGVLRRDGGPLSHADQSNAGGDGRPATAASMVEWPDLWLTPGGDVSVSQNVFDAARELLRQVRESTGWQGSFMALAASGIELRAGRPLILVPQAASKFHSSFDRVLLSTLLAHPGAKLQLLQPAEARLATLLAQRLRTGIEAAFAASAATGTATAQSLLAHSLLSRLEFVEQRSHSRFQSLLAEADVVLDTHPFGGCTTSIEALLAGTPVVTLPHSLALPGRFTQAVLRSVGLEDWVATDAASLVTLVLRVGMSRVHQSAGDRRRDRASLAQRVRARLMSPLPVGEWSELLQRGVRAMWTQMVVDAAAQAQTPSGRDVPGLAVVGGASLSLPQTGWSVNVAVLADGISYDRSSPARHLAVNVTVTASPAAVMSEAAVGMQSIEASTFACLRAAFLPPACAPLDTVTLVAAVPATWALETELTITDSCAVECSLGRGPPDMGCVCAAALVLEATVISTRAATSAVPLAAITQALAAAKPGQV